MSSMVKRTGGKHKTQQSTSSMGSGSNLNSKSVMKASGVARQSRVGGASRRSGMQSSQVRGPGALVVRDPETGADITPISLLDASKPTLPDTQLALVDDAAERGSQGSGGFDRASSAGGLSRSGWSDDEGAAPAADVGASLAEEGEPRRPKVVMANDEPCKPADLDKDVAVVLSETETVFVFEIHSSCLADDDPSLEAVKAENAAYTELVRARETAEHFAERAMQTRIVSFKHKDAQATPAPTASVGVNVTNFEIHDAVAADDKGAEEKDEDLMGDKAAGKHAAAGLSAVDLLQAASASESPDPAAQAILALPAFKQSLVAMERSLLQNVYHPQQLKYRGLASPGEADDAGGEEEAEARGAGRLEELWAFDCELSRGRNVSCLAWNPAQADLLAVGYGEHEFTKQGDGLVLFWSLKNPEFPMRALKAPCSVTALAFAKRSPHLLGVGLYDGTVAVYDVRKEEDRPVLESGFGGGKHAECVWGLCWTEKEQGAERGEVLVSVSSDGRVAQWSMSKGLAHSDLIRLKRVGAAGKGGASGAKREAFISRMASGMCIDFNPRDQTLYLVGTEEGSLHKCSVSYNEQYLDTYAGHSGPVYKVAWSPFLPSAFLSCSADWSVKLWHADADAPLLSMQSSSDYVADIQWSPTVSTVFAAVTGDGDVNIWDMSVSTLDPVFKASLAPLGPEAGHSAPGRPSAVRFAPNADVLVAGDSAGRVTVYALRGIDSSSFSHAEQVARLEKALAAKDLQE